MPKNDPVVKSFPHAKELSLQKWHKIRKDLEALLKEASQPCGFCLLTSSITGVEHAGGCLACLVADKCAEADQEVHCFLEGTLNYIEQGLIPWIKNFELNGEAS